MPSLHLQGLHFQENLQTTDTVHKDLFNWISQQQNNMHLTERFQPGQLKNHNNTTIKISLITTVPIWMQMNTEPAKVKYLINKENIHKPDLEVNITSIKQEIILALKTKIMISNNIT